MINKMRYYNQSNLPIVKTQTRLDRLKNVLMISRAFPPESGSAVHRPLKFTKFLPEYGWIPYVITPKKNIEPIDNSLMRDVPLGISVNEVFSLDPANLKAILTKNRKCGHIGEIGHLFLTVLLKAYSIIYYRIVIVDWHEGWIPFGFIRARQIFKKENIDLIYVDMEPPSSSIIGLLLKQITGKPLVIDYHDPWTTSIYAKQNKGIRKKIGEYLEHKVLHLADKVIAGKYIIISELIEKFSDVDKRKFLTIHSGYDPDDFVGHNLSNTSSFIVTYTGKISDKFYYSPESFLYALGELIKDKKIPKEDVTVLFVGTVSSKYKSRFRRLLNDLDLRDVVINTGNVNHRQCVEYQMNSNLLLYFIESLKGKEVSYEFSGALPSKLYEYLYTGKPILAIVPPGFEADLIRKTRTGFIAEPNNVKSIKNLLFELYKKYKQNALRINANLEEVSKYDRKVLTGKLASVFDEIYTEAMLKNDIPFA